MQKVVKMGVVGLGRGRNVMSEILEESTVKLVSICDSNAEKREDAIKHFSKLGANDLQCYEDFDEMLKSDIDAVYIATDAI